MKPSRIFVPSLGPSYWRAFLADPFVQWRRGKSALELAVSWEAVSKTDVGIPVEIADAFNSHPDFAQVELIIVIPEHRVNLDDERKPSQNDIWAIVWTPKGYVSVTIEAKAGEKFDNTIEEWLEEKSNGKEQRLKFLTKELGLIEPPPGSIRYQLVHRTVASLLEAKRCHFQSALMLVQSFEEYKTSWSDYEKFAGILGITAVRGKITGPNLIGDVNLYLGWVDSQKATDAVASNAL
jgi:hypothetical protein